MGWGPAGRRTGRAPPVAGASLLEAGTPGSTVVVEDRDSG
ncbi:hypothetical protein MINT15_02550 [Saccharomonospora viridis]|uniref:Uncharacterized protein n=1 Tax=Saccharomonospora viridis TaxID=1852 RepID=A0A837DHX9_9PSEU|nr:hypothetical protein MINT15_02550 [Saccharomonospora viridis]